MWWTELRFADRHLYLSLDCSILSVWNFQLCTKEKKKINPNLPIVVILFVKPVMINILNGYQYSVLLVAHQPFRQVFLFMNPNWILFCFIQWRCIFIPYFTVFFLSGLIKMIMNTAFFLDFFFFTCLSLLLLSFRAASVCVTTLCLFPTCIIKDTFKLNGPDVWSLSSHSLYLFIHLIISTTTPAYKHFTPFFFLLSFSRKKAAFKPALLKFSSGLRRH